MSSIQEKSLACPRKLVVSNLALGLCVLVTACGSQRALPGVASAGPTPASPSPAPAPSPSPSPDPSSGSSSSPVAFVYVSSTAKNSSTNQINAFAASANGTLTPVTGSPFAEDVTAMAVAGSTLFGENSDGYELNSYAIQSDGSLQFEGKTNASQPNNCNTLGPLFLDHSGATLYALEYRGSGCANNTYESFALKGGTGALTDLGNSTANNWLTVPASFLANNAYAYTASCVSDMYGGIYGFQRGANGQLVQISVNAAKPTPPSGSFYCPTLAATDGSDHVAIAMQAVDQQSFSASQPAQLATYTASANGSLTTASTAQNMPPAPVGNVTDLKMSPSGTLLAVAGSGGLAVFHFNGGAAITADTGLLTSDAIDQCFWDGQNHLYAISHAAGKLYVFTVTDRSASPAQGSPYSLNSPQNLAVQSVQ